MRLFAFFFHSQARRWIQLSYLSVSILINLFRKKAKNPISPKGTIPLILRRQPSASISPLFFLQITRAQYQNGLMASRLDSTPQSPESGHNAVRVDQATPPATANTTITDLGADSTPTENGPDETTLLLLNEQNSPHTANHHSQLENSI